MGAVLGEAMLTGVAAGAIAAVLAVPAVMAYDALQGNPASFPTGASSEVLLSGALAGLLLGLLVTFVGALAGMLFGAVSGAVLGAVRAHLTGRPGRCRIAGLVAFGGPVGIYALVLALLGTSPAGWVLLCGSPLVVAVVAGVWRGPAIVDGQPGRTSVAAAAAQ